MAASVMTIELSSSPGPHHIITSDQTISGKVTFSNKQDRPTGIVTISLVGRSETSFKKGGTIYYGKATLFHLSKTLHDGLLRQNQYEWPFEFTFPRVTDGEKKKWLDIPPYQVTEGHQLPPSMVFDSKDLERDSGVGSVVYMLESGFSKSSKSSVFSPLESTSLALYYIPYRKFETPAPKIALLGKEAFTCTSKLLGPAGEKPKSFFKRIKTPCSVFEVAITAPHAVYNGGPLPITLSLTHDLQNSTATEVPTVKLTSCTVILINTMHATGKAVFEDDGKFSTAELLIEKKDLDIPLSESQSLSDLLSLPSIRTKYGMSFATYNLARTFKLMVKVTVECVGKIFWTELRSRNITVLSPFTKDLLEKGGGIPPSLILGMNNISEGGDIVTGGVSLLLNVLGIGASLNLI
ncbi:hypothetical protein B0O99DRAFT_644044 [Bisporella sp. PMI_857]|nr:hypothetical protein B0O99DRAFT_644044 [Bisporella sp. PMI_857]